MLWHRSPSFMCYRSPVNMSHPGFFQVRGAINKFRRNPPCLSWAFGVSLVCHPVGNRPRREGCRLRLSASDVDGSLQDDKQDTHEIQGDFSAENPG